jgi:hypothetical protein
MHAHSDSTYITIQSLVVQLLLQIIYFAILLCSTPQDFTHQGDQVFIYYDWSRHDHVLFTPTSLPWQVKSSGTDKVKQQHCVH